MTKTKNKKYKSSSTKSSRRKRKPSSRGEPEFNFDNLSPWAQKTIALLIFVFLVWVFVIQPIIEWAKQNITTIIPIFIGLIALAIVGCILYWKYKTKKEYEKAREKEKLINQVVGKIEDFKQSRNYPDEVLYQIELVGWLKSEFPNADIEQQRGSSRPDIIVGDVAIEVKGPTRTIDLTTIADKCMRYCQHFEELIIVLFEVDVYDRRYEEWEKGMKNTFSNVKIIRK